MPRAGHQNAREPNRPSHLFVNLFRNVPNKLRVITHWVISNPLKSLVISLTLASAFFIKNTTKKQEKDFLDSHLGPWSPRMLPETTKDSITSLPENFSTCPTIIFYEDHTDQAPGNMIFKLLPNLVKNEYRTFIFEEPENMSINTSIQKFLRSIDLIKNRMDDIARDAGEDLSSFDWTEYENVIESYKVSAELMKRIQKAKLNYVAMDLSEKKRSTVDNQYGQFSEKASAIREQHMTQSIMAACKKYKTGQVVLVGAMHNGIEHALRDIGYSNVSSVYIINHTVSSVDQEKVLPRERQGHDQMLRTKNLLYMKKYRYEQVNIINIYDDPNINATKEVLSGLSKRNALT